MSDKEINNYLKLEKKMEQVSHLGTIAALAQWDSAVLLQPGSAPARQKELATMSSLIHEMGISSEVGDLIDAPTFDI